MCANVRFGQIIQRSEEHASHVKCDVAMPEHDGVGAFAEPRRQVSSVRMTVVPVDKCSRRVHPVQVLAWYTESSIFGTAVSVWMGPNCAVL